MKRRTALKRVAAGAGSTVALVGTSTAKSSAGDVEYRYRVTEDGVERLDGVETAGGYCEDYPDCCPECCSDCPSDCPDGCKCADFTC